jgi:ferredoxin-NADP reductase
MWSDIGGGTEGDLQLVVRQKAREADGVLSLLLEDVKGRDLPEWEPGAHLDVCLPGLTRQYSLCGDPGDRRRYRVGILREPASRGGSEFIHEKLRVDDRVIARTPRNNFGFAAAARYLFVAGGIGITPLLPMISRAEHLGTPWRLVYGGRSRSSMAFLSELERYGDRVEIRPQDEYGLLDLDRILNVTEETSIYCCGPEPLIAAVEQRCSDLPAGTLHLERFAARQLPDRQQRVPFEVHCAESDVTVNVGAEESILDALLGAGIDLNYECRVGTCGTCELDLIEGSAIHLDSVLSPGGCESEGVIFPCVSRAVSGRLVLDV